MRVTQGTQRTESSPSDNGATAADRTTPVGMASASAAPTTGGSARPTEVTDTRQRSLREGGATATMTAEPAAAEPAATTEARPPGGRRRGRLVRFVEVLIVGGLVAASSYAVSASGREPVLLGPGVVTVQVGIDHSRFDIGELRVQEGTLVQFVVRNDDPIDHELVVGDAAVHRRHAAGTEGRHPPVPGEVSIAPGDTAMTFYEFNEPGTVVFACHLPGHIAYGMTGEIQVIPAS